MQSLSIKSRIAVRDNSTCIFPNMKFGRFVIVFAAFNIVVIRCVNGNRNKTSLEIPGLGTTMGRYFERTCPSHYTHLTTYTDLNIGSKILKAHFVAEAHFAGVQVDAIFDDNANYDKPVIGFKVPTYCSDLHDSVDSSSTKVIVYTVQLICLPAFNNRIKCIDNSGANGLETTSTVSLSEYSELLFQLICVLTRNSPTDYMDNSTCGKASVTDIYEPLKKKTRVTGNKNTRWNEMYQRLVAYKAEHNGSTNVPIAQAVYLDHI